MQGVTKTGNACMPFKQLCSCAGKLPLPGTNVTFSESYDVVTARLLGTAVRMRRCMGVHVHKCSHCMVLCSCSTVLATTVTLVAS